MPWIYLIFSNMLPIFLRYLSPWCLISPTDCYRLAICNKHSFSIFRCNKKKGGGTTRLMAPTIIIKSQTTDIIRPFKFYSGWKKLSYHYSVKIMVSYWRKCWVIWSGKLAVFWVLLGTVEKKLFLPSRNL